VLLGVNPSFGPEMSNYSTSAMGIRQFVEQKANFLPT